MDASATQQTEPGPELSDVPHRRRLRLEELVLPERVLVGGAFLAIAFCSILVIWESVPLSLPGGRVIASLVGGDLEAELVPTLVMTVGCLGMAAASAVFAYGTTRPGWRLPIATRILLALPAASIATTAYTSEEGVPSAFREEGGLPTAVRYASLGLVAVELLLPLVPSAVWKRLPLTFAAVVAAAWATVPLLYLFDLTIVEDFGLTSRIVATWEILNVALVAVFALQVIEGVRASVRDLGEPLLGLSSSLYWVAPCAIALVLVLALGIAGVLPSDLGGASGAWDRAHDDDLVAWLLAAAMAVGIVALAIRHHWLRGGAASPDWALVAVVATWMTTFVGATILLLVGSIWQVVDLHVSWPGDTAETILRATQEVEAAVIVGAGVVGVTLLLQTSQRAAGMFLTLFSIWNAPAAYALVKRGYASGASGAPEFATLGLAVSVVVAMIALASWVLRRFVPPGAALVLMVFGALALAGPAHDLLRDDVSDTVFYIVLVLPVVYLFLADAERHQPQAGRSTALLLGLVGLTAMSLSIALLRVSLGTLTPETGETGFIRYTLVVPLAAIVVAFAARSWDSRT